MLNLLDGCPAPPTDCRNIRGALDWLCYNDPDRLVLVNCAVRYVQQNIRRWHSSGQLSFADFEGSLYYYGIRLKFVYHIDQFGEMLVVMALAFSGPGEPTLLVQRQIRISSERIIVNLALHNKGWFVGWCIASRVSFGAIARSLGWAHSVYPDEKRSAEFSTSTILESVRACVIRAVVTDNRLDHSLSNKVRLLSDLNKMLILQNLIDSGTRSSYTKKRTWQAGLADLVLRPRAPNAKLVPNVKSTASYDGTISGVPKLPRLHSYHRSSSGATQSMCLEKQEGSVGDGSLTATIPQAANRSAGRYRGSEVNTVRHQSPSLAIAPDTLSCGSVRACARTERSIAVHTQATLSHSGGQTGSVDGGIVNDHRSALLASAQSSSIVICTGSHLSPHGTALVDERGLLTGRRATNGNGVSAFEKMMPSAILGHSQVGLCAPDRPDAG